MRISENEIIIPAIYKSIQHLGKEFNYFVVSNENNKYGIIDFLNQTVVAMNYDSYEQLSDRSFVLKIQLEVIYLMLRRVFYLMWCMIV